MTLYSTPGCPMCQMLAKKMEERGIPFEKCMDVDTMQSIGIEHVPVLRTDDGTMLNLAEALRYVAEEGQTNGVH